MVDGDDGEREGEEWGWEEEGGRRGRKSGV